MPTDRFYLNVCAAEYCSGDTRFRDSSQFCSQCVREPRTKSPRVEERVGRSGEVITRWGLSDVAEVTATAIHLHMIHLRASHFLKSQPQPCTSTWFWVITHALCICMNQFGVYHVTHVVPSASRSKPPTGKYYHTETERILELCGCSMSLKKINM